jgi:hypothetical protein
MTTTKPTDKKRTTETAPVAPFNYTWWRGFTAVSNKNNIILRPPKGDVPAY